MDEKITPDLERVLEAGNSAPSGENCQPWHFVVHGSTIEVHLLPERDQSPYGWGQRASYLANGAVIENIVIAASAEQYRAEVHYFPNPSDEWHVATIVLTKDSTIESDPLASYITKRISNRKPYKKDQLTGEERKTLANAAAHGGYGMFALAEAPEEVGRLGRVGSTNEEVMLANRSLHDFFFSHVSWTKEEDDEKKAGFYIKTLELPPPAKLMFKIFRNWPIMRVLGTIGFNRIVAKQNAATNASASAIGAFMIARTEPLDFVKIGRAVERLWLTATSLGLSLQPLTGVLFFKLRFDGGERDGFSSHEQKLVIDAYQEASRIFHADGKHIAFTFRIGRGDAPSAHAIRFPLAEAVTIQS
ncbi:nitroreductase family protein [Patescibacteria group bacterium]|nr:nitroreductase family protein [Patescibacteria group bacterium]MDE2173332.1 nitroreductase family protein [Patescibacteria group bacterium]